MNNYCVYLHLRADTKIPFYVGKGQPKRPYSRKRNIVWHRIVNKHGFIVYILKKDLIEQEALNLEARIIAKYRKLGWCDANLTEGGDGTSGYKHTEQSLLKISNASKQLKRTLKSRERLSKSRLALNIIVSRETKLKFCNAIGAKPFKCISPNGEESIWSIQTECADEYKLQTSHISNCLSGKRKSHKGYRFEYV